MSLESWNSLSSLSVCVETRQTTIRSFGVYSARGELVVSVTLLPELLCDLEKLGRVESGDCELIELPALWPLEMGRSREAFWKPKKCQLS